MARIIRQTLLSVRDLMATFGPFLVLAIALLIGAYYVLDPTPPRRVVLATGPAQSDYAVFGARYAEELKAYGIDVVLRETDGSTENQRLLQDEREDVDLGFIRGGSNEALQKTDEEEGDWDIESLGSLFYEPLWIFYRDSAARGAPGGKIEKLAQLRGLRVGIGASGSGVPNLLNKLFHANGLRPDDMRVDRQEPPEAVAAFVQGKMDAVILASAPEAPYIQMLLRTPGVRLFEFNQAEAYSRRFPYLAPVTLPRGMVDFARDLPPHDVPLVASTAMLAARVETHPALVQLFVQAAGRIHGESGWFVKNGQFPNASHAEIPLAEEAERFYKNGAPFLQRHLPFWLANLIDRMWVALFSIIAVLIPLSRVVPPMYAFRVRSRIFRWYRVLREIEDDLAENAVPREQLLERLDRLDSRAGEIAVPLAYTDQLYALRSYIQMVRDRLRQSPVKA
jgi:TRAP transporter TAXI family solute receptor